MKSIRKFAYTLVLTLSVLNLTAVLASAQDAKGAFTLTHDVRWQGALVPAGDYQFTLESKGGASEMLMLRKISGAAAGFMMLVHDTRPAPPSGLNQIVLESTASGIFVSKMNLPRFELALHFTVPKEGANTQVARAGSVSAASAR